MKILLNLPWRDYPASDSSELPKDLAPEYSIYSLGPVKVQWSKCSVSSEHAAVCSNQWTARDKLSLLKVLHCSRLTLQMGFSIVL